MEFDHIGKRCSICKKQDYLPFDCHCCDKIYCKEHYKEHRKTITFTKKITTSKKNKQIVYCQKCFNRIELGFFYSCSKCKKFMCIKCRLPEDHDCECLKKNKKKQKCSFCIIT